MNIIRRMVKLMNIIRRMVKLMNIIRRMVKLMNIESLTFGELELASKFNSVFI